LVNKNVLNITLFHYLIPYDKECKAVENIVVSHLHLASFMDKITGDYQLVREKTNTYVNQSDMGNYWGII
jgi:hypothetical protein